MLPTYVPEDIWRMIFQLLHSSSSRSEQEHLTPVLGSVCRFWRTIILDIPQVWTEASARLGGTPAQTAHQLDHLRLSLERARNRPVSITFHPTTSRSSGVHRVDSEALRALVPHMHHIHHLSVLNPTSDGLALRLSFSEFECFLPLQHSSLRTLELDTRWNCTGSRDAFLHLLHVSRGLRALTIKGLAPCRDPPGEGFCQDTLVLPELETMAVSQPFLRWLGARRELQVTTLKNLRLKGYYARDAEVLETLCQMPSLEDVYLYQCEAGSTLFDWLCEKTVVPLLKRLEVVMGVVKDEALLGLLEMRADPPVVIRCSTCPNLTQRAWEALDQRAREQ